MVGLGRDNLQWVMESLGHLNKVFLEILPFRAAEAASGADGCDVRATAPAPHKVVATHKRH